MAYSSAPQCRCNQTINFADFTTVDSIPQTPQTCIEVSFAFHH